MKARLNQAIEIALKPSFLLLGLLGCIAILSCVILLILPISFVIKATIMVVIVFSTLYFILRDGLRVLPWSWQHVQVNSLGELKLINNAGQQFSPMMAATSFIHPSLIILNFEQPMLSQRLLGLGLPMAMLFASNGCQEQHRQLRVWMRWWKHESTDVSSVT